jgi:gluconolactonase
LIRAFDVVDGGKKLANNRVFIDAETGTPDGFRVDIAGNLSCGWGMGDAELDGVRVFDATGKPIGHIALPERAANLCFGGRFRNRLFIDASHGLCALCNTQGSQAADHPADHRGRARPLWAPRAGATGQ